MTAPQSGDDDSYERGFKAGYEVATAAQAPKEPSHCAWTGYLPDENGNIWRRWGFGGAPEGAKDVRLLYSFPVAQAQQVPAVYQYSEEQLKIGVQYLDWDESLGIETEVRQLGEAISRMGNPSFDIDLQRDIIASRATIETLRNCLDNSQSLLAMIHHLGSEFELTRNLWDGEDLTKLTAEQIKENREALSVPSASSPAQESRGVAIEECAKVAESFFDAATVMKQAKVIAELREQLRCLAQEAKHCGVIEFEYCNWEGRKSIREARPISIRFGKSEWHPKPQWLLLAFDIDKGAEREFAMADMAFEDDALAALSLPSAEQLTATPDEKPKPFCIFCGKRVFGPCQSKAQARGCELPSTNSGGAA